LQKLHPITSSARTMSVLAQRVAAVMHQFGGYRSNSGPAADIAEPTRMTQLGQGWRFKKIGLRAIDVFDATILRLWQPLPAEP
jgi:hypothetical protein